jgi:xanthine dehydrogenase molybdopterin-binding subunit B
MVAHVLGLSSHSVTVQVRRMGGGFGGKETQANLFAVVAALAARKFGRAAKIRPDRDADMVATGKRHDFVGGLRRGLRRRGPHPRRRGDAGRALRFSADLSGPVTDRALFHADNANHYPAVRLTSEPLKTNTVSNTAFRGFGGPQGMLAAERIIEEIAYALGRDPLDVRRANFYGPGRDLTPYHQTLEDVVIARIVDELEASSDYQARRAAILAYNRRSSVIRRGIALTPVKFGISFTATWYNQGGALVHVYTDGSVQLNHGGTEMGQGLHTKVAQVLAEAFQIDLDRIRVTATTTGKVPNTSATAASSGTDLNAMAAADAARQVKERLQAFGAERWQTRPENVRFVPNHVMVDDRASPSPSSSGSPIRRGCSFRRPGSTRLRRSIGTDPRAGAAVLLLRLRRRRLGGVGGHADRREPGGPGGHPPRRRPLAEPRHRHRPDRGRLRAGHGLAHHGGAVVGRARAPAHARAVDLQDPARLRPAAGLQRAAGGMVGEPGARGRALQGRGRAALHARDLRAEALSMAAASVADYRIPPPH